MRKFIQASVLIGGDVSTDEVDETPLRRHRPIDPPISAVLTAKAVLHTNRAGAIREALQRFICRRCVVRMAEPVDMHRLDFIIAPTERAGPRGIDADEVAIEVAHSEQILGDLPDAVALTGALSE